MRHVRIHALRSSDMDPPRLAAWSPDHDNSDAANAFIFDASAPRSASDGVTVRRGGGGEGEREASESYRFSRTEKAALTSPREQLQAQIDLVAESFLTC